MDRFPWVLASTVALVATGIVACSDDGGGTFEIPGPGYPSGTPTEQIPYEPARPGVGWVDASRVPLDSSLPDAVEGDAVGDAPTDVASDVGASGDGAGAAEGGAGDSSAD